MPPSVFSSIDGVSDVEADGDVLRMRVNGPIGKVIVLAAQHGLVDVVSREPNLEDVFLAQYGSHGSPVAAGVDSDGR